MLVMNGMATNRIALPKLQTQEHLRNPNTLTTLWRQSTMYNPERRADTAKTVPKMSWPSSMPPKDLEEIAHRGTTSKKAKFRKPPEDRKTTSSGIGHLHALAKNPGAGATEATAGRGTGLTSFFFFAAGNHIKRVARAKKQMKAPAKLGMMAGQRSTKPYVQPPIAGPISCTIVPAPKTVPTTAVCFSTPPISMDIAGKTVTQPFPIPRNTKRTMIAQTALVQKPKSTEPTANKIMVNTSAFRNPKRSPNHPHTTPVGTLPITFADCKNPAIVPA
mmetsp:Transcript_71031/g.148585  ORF Transcript_71031/g.148585 Transcript_71031/m.148585 type:complete len:275 (+) Transcript_71031:861-1685(+)